MRHNVSNALNVDVAVVGAGPVGCVTALAFARQGKKVGLFEANPKVASRLAGEWIHPPAVEILKSLGVDLAPAAPFMSGRGFVVLPEDGSRPVVLPYTVGSFGYSFEHERLVELLREHAAAHPGIEYVPNAKVTGVTGQTLEIDVATRSFSAKAPLIVGANGRSSVLQASLGVERKSGTYSRMAGLLLENVELPFEGYGHVCLGGLGPILAYRIDANRVRLCIDVPHSLRVQRDREAVLYEAYAKNLPSALRPAFRDALFSGGVTWATNNMRPRVAFGREGLVFVGDAVGHHHPLTALGMTLGFQDAVALVRTKSFSSYRRERILRSRVPEMLAVGLYEVFADPSEDVVAIRRAIYEMWRDDSKERFRTMRFLACEETNPMMFGMSFLKGVLGALENMARRGVRSGDFGHMADVMGDVMTRVRWLLGGALLLRPASPSQGLEALKGAPAVEPKVAITAEERYGMALRASVSKADVLEHPSAFGVRAHMTQVEPASALERGVKALVALQAKDGSWEGENGWCPMLPAQYVIANVAMGRPISDERRRRLLLNFEKTQINGTGWGLHNSEGEPYLFTTALVYVACRMLGLPADHPLLVPALDFIHREGGITSIPTWGKAWLSIANLHSWEGVNAILPEMWGLPRWLPIHPSRFYCHTRLIYLGLATLYGERFASPKTPLVEALRRELYPMGFETIDWKSTRGKLRQAELYAEPSLFLRAGFKILGIADKAIPHRVRAKYLAEMRRRIRYELETTHFTNLSPVSGLLNMLALHAENPRDPHVERASKAFEGWIWEDDVEGTRIVGSRSSTWDTSFAMQSLAAAEAHADVEKSLVLGDRFLSGEQIRESLPDAQAFDRNDWLGGYCFAGVWHGWPVSDCTAEALIARIERGNISFDEVRDGVRFITRCQNKDGGFGSYEARRVDMSLEWLNPSEMFGDSMLDGSYIECTASNLAAIRLAMSRFPLLKSLPDLADLDARVARGVVYLKSLQYPNGAWKGMWGVRLVYGTLFGIRGLLAAGVPPTDAAIRNACAFLLSHQRPDGSWGEKHVAHPSRHYVPDDAGSVVQTSWALAALLEAEEPDWDAIGRGARWLASMQLGSGEWPKQAPPGVFFHTALYDYALYKSYFPIWALSLFETRRKMRASLYDKRERRGGKHAISPAAE